MTKYIAILCLAFVFTSCNDDTEELIVGSHIAVSGIENATFELDVVFHYSYQTQPDVDHPNLFIVIETNRCRPHFVIYIAEDKDPDGIQSGKTYTGPKDADSKVGFYAQYWTSDDIYRYNRFILEERKRNIVKLVSVEENNVKAKIELHLISTNGERVKVVGQIDAVNISERW